MPSGSSPGQARLRLDVGLVDPARAEAGGDDGVGARERGRRRRRSAAAGGRRRWAELVLGAASSPPGPPCARRPPSPPPRDLRSAGRVARRRPSPPRGRAPRAAARRRRRPAPAPSSAAASVSATTSATGWPDQTISSRASGSATRPEPPTIGRSCAVSTATTPGHGQRLGLVDAREPGVGLRGQHGPGVQQPVHRHVPHVAGLARAPSASPSRRGARRPIALMSAPVRNGMR